MEYNHAEKRRAGALVSLSELEEVLPDDRVARGVGDGEIAEAISEFLRGEKRDARNVFIRKYWFFDSVSQIAARYSFSEAKVKSMLHHTRGRLRKYLRNL